MYTKVRTKAYSFDDIPGGLPKGSIPGDITAESITDVVLDKLRTLKEEDLTEGATWRDMLALTNNLRTLQSSRSVYPAYIDLSKKKHVSNVRAVPEYNEVARMGPDAGWVNIGFAFTTEGSLKGDCHGIVSVVKDGSDAGSWRIWMLRTWLENYEGHGHPDETKSIPPALATNGANGDSAYDIPILDAIIVGAGQAGLGCAGRFQALGISYLLLEKNPGVGDNWTNRYESLKWHTTRDYGQLPFDRTYETSEEYLLPVKAIGAGFKRWSDRHGINVALSTAVRNAVWDDATHVWTINTNSENESLKTLKAKNLILACGSYASVPNYPDIPGRDRYKGTAVHGLDYKSASPWASKRGIVVGTANTGHDVAEDMVDAGFSSVTMVQRGHTFVFPAEWLWHAQDSKLITSEDVLKAILTASQTVHYNGTMHPSLGDRIAYTTPNKITREMINKVVHHLIDTSPQRFDDLEKAGFKLERYGDIYTNLYTRFGGHYVDTGASARISKGEIKMKGEAIKEWTEDGLRFEDGSEIKAELVVMCTGFEHDFRNVARKIVGDAAEVMDEYFGVDEEGEIRGAWKFAGREYCPAQNEGIGVLIEPKADLRATDPGLYYAGGDIRQCRWFSRFLALQIQADLIGGLEEKERYTETPR